LCQHDKPIPRAKTSAVIWQSTANTILPEFERATGKIAALEQEKEALPKNERKASAKFVRNPWSGNLDDIELSRPGGPLLAALIRCANERRLQLNEMAQELGIHYSYINQLRNGMRQVRQVSEEFTIACARFLGVPRMSVMILAGKVTTSDFFESEDMMAAEISNAIGFICNDISWGHLITPELRRSDVVSQFAVVKLYEGATGKVLLNKALDCESMASRLAKLESIQIGRKRIVNEHSLKKAASLEGKAALESA
jgi:hypothetical protein